MRPLQRPLGCHPDGEGDQQSGQHCQWRHAAQMQQDSHATQRSQIGAHPAADDLPYGCAELQEKPEL